MSIGPQEMGGMTFVLVVKDYFNQPKHVLNVDAL
jgi:hypothetical protein